MTRSGLLILVAALIGGVAIGYVAGTSGSTPVSSGEERQDIPKRPGPAPEWREPAPSGSPRGTGSLEAALLEITDDKFGGAGTGTITGIVKTDKGRPLADVLIRAVWLEDQGTGAKDTSGSPPEEEDLAEQVREFVRSYRRDRALRRETRTDAEGRFEIGGLGTDDYWIQAFLKGWFITGARGRSTYKIKAGSTVELMARPRVGIPIEIVMPDGTTPQAAWIEAKQGDNRNRHGWSREHSTLHLSPGDYQLTAIAGDDGEMKSGPVSVVLEQDRAAEPMRFELVLKPGIRGQVAFPEGGGPRYVQVAALPLPAGKEPDLKRLAGATKRGWAYVSRPEFTIADLEPGRYVVGVIENYQRVLVHEIVEVGEGFTEVELTIPELKPEDSILVNVEGPDGNPLSDVRLRAGVMTRHGPVNFGMGQEARKQQDGLWRIAHGSVPPGWDDQGDTDRCYVEVESGKYGMKRVEYTKGTDTSVTIRFEEPASLVVVLSGYRGTSYVGSTRIGLQPLSESKTADTTYGGFSDEGPDSEGVQQIEPVAPGEYQLNVYLQVESFSLRFVHREKITVKAGENRIAVSLPVLHRLTIIVPDEEDGTTVSYNLTARRRTNFGLPSGKKDDQNRVVFDMIPAGEYLFTIHGGRSGRKMIVTVPGPAVVRFQAQVFNARLVTIDDPDGTMAAAGLKDGDLVIGVDGVEFTNDTQMRARLMEARAKESAKLVVLRGRKRLELTVDLTKISGRNAGGRMSPAVR